MARALLWSGATIVLNQFRSRDFLLVLTYHRIGNADHDLFDPGVFSATEDELDEQISYLKKHVSLITIQEAKAFIEGTLNEDNRRSRVLITFDDGYLDNYEKAFPILRSHGVQGVFFLPTSMIGSCHIPWWDHIAYLMNTARKRLFRLHYPAGLVVDVDKDGVTKSLRNVLKLYKSANNTDPEQFIRDLKEHAQGENPPGTLRRFIGWDEAREMVRGGMAIGSHTHSHRVLTQLGIEQQRLELMESRAKLKEKLGSEVDALAYPVGNVTSFSGQTQDLALEAGYRVAFSKHGGVNLPKTTRPYDVKRVGVGDQSWHRFRVQAAVCKATAKYWP